MSNTSPLNLPLHQDHSQSKTIPLSTTLQSQDEKELSRLQKLIKKSLNPQKKYRVLFFEEDRPASVPQKNYLRVIEGQFCKHFGLEMKQFHEDMKERFSMDFAEIDGTTFEYKRSTNAMNTTRLTKFIEDVRMFMRTEHGFDTPDPKRIPDEIYVEMYRDYNQGR